MTEYLCLLWGETLVTKPLEVQSRSLFLGLPHTREGRSRPHGVTGG